MSRHPIAALALLTVLPAAARTVAPAEDEPTLGPVESVPIANATWTPSGTVLPIYPVAAEGARVKALTFEMSGDTVRAGTRAGQASWSREVGAGTLFGGFDLDADGWPDVGVVQADPNGILCGGIEAVDTSIQFLSGRTGGSIGGLAPLADICWDFGGGTIYTTSQWTAGTVLFGPDGGTVAASPYYSTNSWFMSHDGTGLRSEYFFYPSSTSYDASYVADLPSPWNGGQSYVQYAHVANGLITEVAGERRVVFFTSGRVVQYAVEPFGSLQLRVDHPFVSGGRLDMAGRNYGLVAVDPRDPDTVALIGGTTAYSLFVDMSNGTLGYDEWGQIERHVALYDTDDDVLDDRFFSYAHDGGDAYKYEGRVVYPDGPFIAASPDGPSRLAYNVYEGGRWNLHISEPGRTVDRFALIDVFLWDVRDLDGDGIDEIIASPTRFPEEPAVPGYYFAKWQTTVYHWDEANELLVPIVTYLEGIPYLASTFRRGDRTTSMSYRYPALTVEGESGVELVLRDASGGLHRVAYPVR